MCIAFASHMPAAEINNGTGDAEANYWIVALARAEAVRPIGA
jgi:hypothetical protein